MGALSVRLGEGFLVLMAACTVKSNCVLYLVVVSIVVLYQAILCPVVREWWQEQIDRGSEVLSGSHVL